MLQSVYGGSPLDWWALTPYRLAGFILNRSKAEAYSSLRRVDELIVSNPGYEKTGRQNQIDHWKRLAGIVEKEKPMAQKLQMFAEAGMKIEFVD